MYKAVLIGIVSGGIGFAAGYVFCKKKLEKDFVEKTEAALKDIQKLKSTKNNKEESKETSEPACCSDKATKSSTEAQKRL